MGFISLDQVEQIADGIPNDYGQYLKTLIRETRAILVQPEMEIPASGFSHNAP